MTDNTTPEAATAPDPTTVTTTSVPDLIAYEEARTADRAARQAEADEVAAKGIETAAKEVAAKEKAAYLKATEPTRAAPNYVERFAAYDTVALRFIEGTVGTSAAAARTAAKGLGHEGQHIETRPV